VRAIDAAPADCLLAFDKTDPPPLYTQVSQQFTARRQALLDTIAQEEQAARARHDRAAALQVRDKLAATVPTCRQSAESFTKLHTEGFVGERMANDKRRGLIEREQDLKAQEATLQAFDAAIAQSERRITERIGPRSARSASRRGRQSVSQALSIRMARIVSFIPCRRITRFML
jgi:HlyD family secretion protein